MALQQDLSSSLVGDLHIQGSWFLSGVLLKGLYSSVLLADLLVHMKVLREDR